MGALVVAYALQTGLVWSDPSSQEPLTGEALLGAELWHQHNCQACHQLYGYGGFLGPDLTNVATLHGPDGLRERLAWVLEEGPGAMPVIPASSGDLDALTAWLVVMDETGVGQARAPEMGSRRSRFSAAVEDLLEPGTPSAEGYALWQSRPCGACHQPLVLAPGGAPDLSLAPSRLGPADLAQVLAEGRPPLMPDPDLDPEEQAAMSAWLLWLEAHRPELLEAVESQATLSWADLPWWEFE